MRTSTRFLAAIAALTLPACSAIVAPDPSRLGNVDAGGAGTVDARIDPSTDAYIVPGTDAFSPLTPDAFVAMGCAGGCDDGDPCTIDECVESRCVSRPSGSCTMGPDTCETSQLVDLSSGSAVVRGDFGALAADYATYCIDEGRRPGRDAVYRIELGANVRDVRIETVGDVDTVLSIASECGEAFGLPTCNDDARDGDANARLFLHPTAGTIYVLVSAFDAAAGPYEVRFTATEVAPSMCGDGSLDVTDGGTVIGVPLPPSRVSGTCMPDGTGRAIEAAMHLDAADADFTLFTGFPAYLHVRSTCELRSEELCEATTPLGGGAAYLDTNVRSDASRLHVFVDGAASSEQPYILFVQP